MSHAIAKEALEMVLSNYCLSKNIPVEYINVPFENNDPESIYISSIPSPDITASYTYSGDHRMYRGLYQININIPVGKGVKSAQELISDITSLYPLYQPIIRKGMKVIPITPMNEMPPLKSGATMIYSISLGYRIDTNI